MSLANSAALAAASALFDGTMLGSVFNGPGGFIGKQLCTDLPGQKKSAQLQVTLATPRVRAWLGSKQVRSPRAYNQIINQIKYEKTIGLDRFDVVNDNSGSVLQAIERFIQQIPDDLEDLIISTLLANTSIGYDNVSLLNAAHPFSNSTGNNITTAALSFESFRAAKSAMRLFADEDGRPWNMNPNTLLVGPALERLAKEIAGADRPVSVDSSGGYDATSSVVGATVIPNAFQGDVTVLVSNKIGGNQWFVMDLSKPVGPVVRPVSEELHLEQLLEPSNSHTFFTDEVLMSGQGYMGFGPGMWQTVYGRVLA